MLEVRLFAAFLPKQAPQHWRVGWSGRAAHPKKGAMFIDARQIPEGQVLEAEICIIGAGAAGITVAKSLASREARVILLESGGEGFDEATHTLTRALDVGRPYPYLPASRLRYFGGSTNHWGGHCVPMRPVNFETSPSIPYSGWPFGYDELEPYYRRAHDMLGL